MQSHLLSPQHPLKLSFLLSLMLHTCREIDERPDQNVKPETPGNEEIRWITCIATVKSYLKIKLAENIKSF